jgi:Putative esterase
MHQRFFAALLICGLLLAGAGSARAGASLVPPHSFFHVQLGSTETQPQSGRLLLFAINAKDAEAQEATHGGKIEHVDANAFRGSRTAVAAREVNWIVPGQVLDIDTDGMTYPVGWSQLPHEDYYVQAVLDVHHDYNYSGRDAGDLVSPVLKLQLPAVDTPTLTLNKTLPTRDPWSVAGQANEQLREAFADARAHSRDIDFMSPVLAAFWGRFVHMRGRILLPPGYDAQTPVTYPTLYFTQGFGGNNDRVIGELVRVYTAMKRGQMPPMIWVFLDESSPTGTHEFADSVNNGPWGRALTTELIPYLEKRYRMDADVNGRFLQGHSSGGWATLWLQTRYPKIFGGTWSTSPDPSDLHDFAGVDLYVPRANVYHRPDGTPYPLVRDHANVLATFEQFARLERVLGAYGGQMASFDWVFSPKGKDGRPEPMFDRDTGDVDPRVVAYWRGYDIAYRLQRHWSELKPDLDGRIHIWVGTADTFYLDGAVHKLKAVLDGLHARSDIHFVANRTHSDLYRIGKDPQGLMKQFTWEMYAIARPHSRLKAMGE